MLIFDSVYNRSSSASNERVVGNLDRVQRQNSKLQYQMQFLRRKQLRNSIKSARAAASLISLNQHFDLPQTVSNIFTGRDTQLKKLKHMLDVTTPPRHDNFQKRFVIHGLGGSGKTQFCCKFAQAYREQ